jgi:Ca-activated chloride channel family protein
MYALNDVDAQQRKVIELFTQYCQTEKAQKSADGFGFNRYNDYVGVENTYTGRELFSALQLWKQNKDSGRPVISVFVVDRSGSMDGEKIVNVKKSLLGALPSISEGNSIGLVSYSGEHDITVDLPITQISQLDQTAQYKFAGAVADLLPNGQTATNSALVVGLNMLREAQATQSNAKLRMFLLSDGETNEGLPLQRVVDVVDGLEIPVYAIGFEVPSGLDDLKELSSRNEASYIDAGADDVVYKIRSLFISEM